MFLKFLCIYSTISCETPLMFHEIVGWETAAEGDLIVLLPVIHVAGDSIKMPVTKHIHVCVVSVLHV